MKGKKRSELALAAFRAEDGPRALMLPVKTGAHGLNLVSLVLFLSEDFHFADARLGTTSIVVTRVLVLHVTCLRNFDSVGSAWYSAWVKFALVYFGTRLVLYSWSRKSRDVKFACRERVHELDLVGWFCAGGSESCVPDGVPVYIEQFVVSVL